jgi:hypothetical protein
VREVLLSIELVGDREDAQAGVVFVVDGELAYLLPQSVREQIAQHVHEVLREQCQKVLVANQ